MGQKRLGLPQPDPRCQAIPEALERVIRAGLAGKPEDRPGMPEFVEYTGDPHAPQKARTTTFPLSA